MIRKILGIVREKNMLSLTTSLLTAFIGLVNFMLLTRSLDKESFGHWVLFITMATFIDMLRFGLTSNALIRFASTDDRDKREEYLGASYKIGMFAIAATTILLWGSYAVVILTGAEIGKGYKLFLAWYPLLSLLNLSWNNSVSYFQARQDFNRVLNIRLFSLIPFIVFLGVNYLYLSFGIETILIVFLISNLLPSLYVFYKKWDGLSHVAKASKEAVNEMLNFGKYSMGTLVGTSLLKSADTIIIGMSAVLGPVGVALYAIPLKLTDLLSIPLRSFSITAYPKMSLKSNAGDVEGLKKVFYTYSGAVTLLFIPISIVCFIFAKQLVLILGGGEYIDSLPLLVTVFRIFVIYSVLLPLDRFTGVALDSINRPRFNFYKVIMMTAANIIGDIIAVFWLQSIEAVAIVTVAFTLMGIVAGYVYLNKFIAVNIGGVFREGFNFLINLKEQIRLLR